MTEYLNPSTRSGGVKQIVVPERATTVPVDDAPFDDEQYVRVNGEWVPYTAPPIIPDTLAPKPPTGLGGTGTMAADGTSVTYTLDWDAPTENTDNSPLTDFAYYVLRWRYAGMSAWVTLTTNELSYILPNLMPATNIQWEVLARDSSGNDSTWASNTVTGVADTSGPLQPSQPALASRLGSIAVQWDGLLAGATAPPADFDYLEVYMSATTGGPWAPVGRLSGSGAVVVASIDVGATRFFSFVAVDTSGNASTRSSESNIVVQGVTGPDIEANAITANMIATGVMGAAMTITGYLLAGNPTGSRVVIDGEGIRQYDDLGNLLTNIPTDPDQPATFEGAVIADSITIKDYMSLQGLANKVARGAVLTLEGGTSSPAQAPSVAVGYSTYDTGRWTFIFVPIGTHHTMDDDDDVMAALTFFSGGRFLGPVDRQYDFPERTTNTGNITNQHGNFSAMTAIYTSAPRMVVHGNVCRNNGDAITRELNTFDHMTMDTVGATPPVLKARLAAPGSGYDNTLMGRALSPIGSSALRDRFALLQAYGTSPVTLRLYSATDAAISLVSTLTVTAPWVTDEGPIGVTYGSSAKMLFPGTDQNIWLLHGSVNTYAFTTGGVRLPEFDFPTPPGASRMNAWGDLATNTFFGFRTVEWSPTSPITKMTNNHWSGATSSKWWASTTNFDSNITGGTHESPQGPRASITMKKRAGLIVTVPPYPVRPDPITDDDPLSAKIYIGRGAGDPGYLYMELAGQTDNPNRTLLIGDFTFPAGVAVDSPPATGDFPSSSPAKIVPGETTNWFLSGDGSAAIGGFTVASDGTTIANAHQVTLGDPALTNGRQLQFKSKATGNANYYEMRQYLIDNSTFKSHAEILLENGVEKSRLEVLPDWIRLRTGGLSSWMELRTTGITSPGMRTQMFEGDGTTVSTTSTTGATMGAAGAQGTFVAPPSGVITVTVGGQIRNATAGQSCVLGFEIKTGGTIGSGTTVLAYHIDRTVLNANVQNIRSERSFLVSGLTPGSTYNTRTIYATTNATASASAAWCALLIRPEP